MLKIMIAASVATGCIMLHSPSHAIDLPPQVTPAIRAACETDVRRLCIGPGATQASVIACVVRKFANLNGHCRDRLAKAGFWRLVQR